MAAVVGCLVPPGIPPTCLGLGLPSNSYNPRSNPCLAPATPRRCNQPEAEFPQLSAVKDPTLPHPFNTQRPTLQQQAGFCPSPFLEPLAPTTPLPVTPGLPPGSSFSSAFKHMSVLWCLSQKSLSLPGAHSPFQTMPHFLFPSTAKFLKHSLIAVVAPAHLFPIFKCLISFIA